MSSLDSPLHPAAVTESELLLVCNLQEICKDCGEIYELHADRFCLGGG